VAAAYSGWCSLIADLGKGSIASAEELAGLTLNEKRGARRRMGKLMSL
jgi:hypothetical protein